MALGGDVAGQGHGDGDVPTSAHGSSRLEGPMVGQSRAVELEPGSATGLLGQGLMAPGLM